MPENQKGRGNQGGGRNGSGDNSERGLASADKQTSERASRDGGKRPKGGGRQSESGSGSGKNR